MEDNKLCLEKQPLNQEMLDKIDAYWRAANYLSAGQLYLLDNPLLREPLTMDQIKKKIVGHWGTVPGQNFVYAHCNRVIKRYDLDMILLSGPGHGGNFMIANTLISLNVLYQGYLINFNQISCMQFSRYILTDLLSVIRNLKCFFQLHLKSLITGKFSFSFFNLAPTCSPTPSPVQYHRPIGS